MFTKITRTASCILLGWLSVVGCNSETSQIRRARSVLTTYEQKWFDCQAMLEGPQALAESLYNKLANQQQITPLELRQLEQSKKAIASGVSCVEAWRRAVQEHARQVRVSADALEKAVPDWESELKARRRATSGGAPDRFSWTVDGQELRATENGMGAWRGVGDVRITGVDCRVGSALSIEVPGDLKLGTLTVGPDFRATFIPDWRTDRSSEINWTAESGSLTVSAVSETKVSGGFVLKMVPGPDNPRGGTKSLQGDFEVSFQDGTICF